MLLRKGAQTRLNWHTLLKVPPCGLAKSFSVPADRVLKEGTALTAIGPKGLSWVEFDFTSMSWQQFQAFGNQLLYLLSHRDPDKYGCRSFLPALGEGPDRGCDGYHVGKIESQDGEWNVQIKCYSDPAGIHLTDWYSGTGPNRKPNKGEITKTKDLSLETARRPDGLLMIVSCEVPPKMMQDWEAEIKAAGLNAAIWDRDKLRGILTQLTPDIIFGADRVFVPVLDWKPTPFLLGQDDYGAPVVGRTTALAALNAFVSAEQNCPAWALVTGLDGVGKTHLVCRWSRDYAEQALAAENRDESTPRWPVAVQGDWKGGLSEHVLRELDPTGRQIIIVDSPLETHEWADLAHSLASEVQGKKIKLIVAANGWQAKQAREAFANWGSPVEIPVNRPEEQEFYTLAKSWGVDDRWRFNALRLTNGLPGLLRLALASDKPLDQLSQHAIITLALSRLSAGVGSDPVDQRAVTGVLAWISLTQPLHLQPEEEEKARPEAFADYDVTPRAWRKAWQWLLSTKHLIQAHYAHVQRVYISSTRLVCQAALWQVWSELAPSERMAMVWEAVAVNREHAINNAIEACVCVGDENVGKQLLDGLWAGWQDELLKATPSDQLVLLKQTDTFAYHRPNDVLKLCDTLADLYAGLPPEITDELHQAFGISLHRDWLLEPLIEMVGRAAVRSGNGAQGLRTLMKLDFLRVTRTVALHNDPALRQVHRITSPQGLRSDETRLPSALIVLKEWTQSADPKLRGISRYGLSQALSVAWDDDYHSGSNTITLWRRQLSREPEWLKALRDEAFRLLLECAIDPSLPPGERSTFLSGDLMTAHRLLAQKGPGGRPDLIDELCTHFMKAIAEPQETDAGLVHVVQLIGYLGEVVVWGLIPNTDTAATVHDAVVSYLSGTDTPGDYLRLFGTSVSLSPEKDLVRSNWLMRDEAKQLAEPIARRWYEEHGSGISPLADRVHRVLFLASSCHANNFEPMGALIERLVSLAGDQLVQVTQQLFGRLDPNDPYDSTFLLNWLRDCWTIGSNPDPKDVLEWTGGPALASTAELILQAIGHLRFEKSMAPPSSLDVVSECLKLVSQRCVALNITEVCWTLSRTAGWQSEATRILETCLHQLTDTPLFLEACDHLGLHWEDIKSVVSVSIREYLVERLTRVDELSSKCYRLLGALFANDLNGLLDFVGDRWKYGVDLGKAIGKYRPVSFRMMEEISAYSRDKYKRWSDADIQAAPAKVRDWLLFTYPLASLEIGHLFDWVDGLQPDRDPVSGLGVATAWCLTKWITGGDPGGQKLEVDGKLIDTTGIKYWGVAQLLRDKDFDEPLFAFLIPLIELGEMPDKQTAERNWRHRIWRELWVSSGDTDVYTPGLEREQALLDLYRTMEEKAPPTAKQFFERLRTGAEHEVEREMLPDAGVEL